MKPLSKIIISNGANDVCLLDLVTDLGGNKPTVLIGARNIHGHIKRTKGVKSGFIATTLDGVKFTNKINGLTSSLVIDSVGFRVDAADKNNISVYIPQELTLEYEVRQNFMELTKLGEPTAPKAVVPNHEGCGHKSISIKVSDLCQNDIENLKSALISVFHAL